MAVYEVVVGNIGKVHEGNNPVDARKIYGEYRAQSLSNTGRAGGEDVTLFKDGEPELEFVGQLTKDQALADELNMQGPIVPDEAEQATEPIKHSYANGWRPEPGVKQVALDMLEIIFNPEASVTDCQMAATTLVEAVCPEVLPQSFDEAAAKASFREWCQERGQFP